MNNVFLQKRLKNNDLKYYERICNKKRKRNKWKLAVNISSYYIIASNC